MARAFEQRGARVTAIDSDTPSAPIADVDGIADLSALTTHNAPAECTPERILRTAAATFDVLRTAYASLADSNRAWYVAAVSLGGDLGLGGASAEPLGARFVGLARALQRELPALTCKVVDFTLGTPASSMTDRLIDEMESGDPHVAVAYQAGRRLIPRFQLMAEPPAEQRAVWLPEGTRCLMSGGGRGILFDCAIGLRRLGAKVVVS